jgi:hypothetical protein
MAIAIGGIQLLRWGRERLRTDAQIGAAILIGSPWFFDDPGKLVGFVGGVALTLFVVLRKPK